MASSSVSVVMSSLHLNFWKRPSWMKLSVLDPGADAGERAKEDEMEKLEKKGLVGRAVEWARDAWDARRWNREEGGYLPLRDMGEH
jgi:Cu+-exporting ATPase